MKPRLHFKGEYLGEQLDRSEVEQRLDSLLALERLA